MVDLISEVDASIYIIDSLWNMNEDLIKKRYEAFIRALHKRHPDIPILIAEDCTVFGKLPTPKGKLIKKIFEKLKRQDPISWKNLYYLSAKEMLPDDGEGSVDGCHLNDWGAMHQGKAYGKRIKDILKAEGILH